ncbi:MAG: rhodanese-like domain-containing protein [Myxococcota bacterium]
MKRLDYREFADVRDDEWRLIDVREQNEYDEVHVKGVELFPLSKLKRGDLPEEDDRKVAVICRSGGRSQMACQILEKNGWEECTNIDGGTMAAIQAGDEHVERG